jgi:hypothetical protein
MNIMVDRFPSGWIGLSIEMSVDEIDELVDRLNSLKEGRNTHFHIRSNEMDGEPGVADIEFSMLPSRSGPHVVE